jgi:hypothetical protein
VNRASLPRGGFLRMRIFQCIREITHKRVLKNSFIIRRADGGGAFCENYL